MSPRGIAAIARDAPEREAIICGDRVVSWRELADRTHRVAGWLAGEGVGRGDRVVVLSRKP